MEGIFRARARLSVEDGAIRQSDLPLFVRFFSIATTWRAKG